MKPTGSDKLAPAASAKKHALFEPVALVLLSLATVGTAWCSFQAAVLGLGLAAFVFAAERLLLLPVQP